MFFIRTKVPPFFSYSLTKAKTAKDPPFYFVLLFFLIIFFTFFLFFFFARSGFKPRPLKEYNSPLENMPLSYTCPDKRWGRK